MTQNRSDSCRHLPPCAVLNQSHYQGRHIALKDIQNKYYHAGGLAYYSIDVGSADISAAMIPDVDSLPPLRNEKAERQAAEAMRADLIGSIDLRVVGGGGVPTLH